MLKWELGWSLHLRMSTRLIHPTADSRVFSSARTALAKASGMGREKRRQIGRSSKIVHPFECVPSHIDSNDNKFSIFYNVLRQFSALGASCSATTATYVRFRLPEESLVLSCPESAKLRAVVSRSRRRRLEFGLSENNLGRRVRQALYSLLRANRNG